MPYGKGTYGSKVGRPKKQSRTSKPSKMPMKTNRAQTAEFRKKRKR